MYDWVLNTPLQWNENEQNVISYSQLRKTKICLMKKFQTIGMLQFISHIILKNSIHIIRRWVYINRHCNYSKPRPRAILKTQRKDALGTRLAITTFITVKQRTGKHKLRARRGQKIQIGGWGCQIQIREGRRPGNTNTLKCVINLFLLW